jgi:hypothetical protein
MPAAVLAAAALLAHQGGWDEMLMVAAPIALFALILRAANKRAEQRASDAAAPVSAPDGPAGSADPVERGDVGPE